MQQPEGNQFEELLKQAIEENEILRDRVAELEALLVAAQDEIEKRDEAIRELVQNNPELNQESEGDQESSNEEDIDHLQNSGMQEANTYRNRVQNNKMFNEDENESDDKQRNSQSQNRIINVSIHSDNINEGEDAKNNNFAHLDEDSDMTQNNEDSQYELNQIQCNQQQNNRIHVQSQQNQQLQQQQNISNSQEASEEEDNNEHVNQF